MPHSRDRSSALALAYPVRQLGREAFESAYSAQCKREGIFMSARGLETAHVVYCTLWAINRVKRQGFQTTNGQLAAAMTRRGRVRCPRTVQRTRTRLEAMGLMQSHHVRRGGAVAGRRDSLRIHLCRGSATKVLSPRLRQQEQRAFGPAAAPALARSARCDSAAFGGRKSFSSSAGCAGRKRPAPTSGAEQQSGEMVPVGRGWLTLDGWQRLCDELDALPSAEAEARMTKLFGRPCSAP